MHASRRSCKRGAGESTARSGGTCRAQEILTAPCTRERPLVRSRPCPLWSTSVKRWNARTTRPSLVLTTPCGASLSPAQCSAACAARVSACSANQRMPRCKCSLWTPHAPRFDHNLACCGCHAAMSDQRLELGPAAQPTLLSQPWPGLQQSLTVCLTALIMQTRGRAAIHCEADRAHR